MFTRKVIESLKDLDQSMTAGSSDKAIYAGVNHSSYTSYKLGVLDCRVETPAVRPSVKTAMYTPPVEPLKLGIKIVSAGRFSALYECEFKSVETEDAVLWQSSDHKPMPGELLGVFLLDTMRDLEDTDDEFTSVIRVTNGNKSK